MNFGALPPGALPIYGFEAKWLWDRPERPLPIFECPARIDEDLREQIERVTLAAYRALGCRDWSRVDVRLDAAGVPNVVEVNPLPGILPDPADNSCFPKAARAAGLSYDELIQTCLVLAAERQGIDL
jgi:D-alanine-D-alanine ligase